MNMIRRKAALDSTDKNLVDNSPRTGKRFQNGQQRIVVASVTLLGALCVLYHFSDLNLSALESFHAKMSESSSNQSISSSVKASAQKLPTLTLTGSMPVSRPDYSKEFGDCTAASQPPAKSKSTWTTKPLWLPGYPATLGGLPGGGGGKGPDLSKPLVTRLTGLPQGAKNYHASSRQLKRCKGATEAATCAQIHPIVPIDPEKHVKNFSPKVIFTIRNFVTAYPTAHSFKANKYHNVKGQVAQEEWQKLRDEYMQSSFDGWKNMVLTWKKMNQYKIAMYLPYEHLLDRTKGPAKIQRLATLFREEGFSNVAPEKDMDCIWYQVTQQALEFEKEYYQYTPGYTAKQRDFLEQAMQKFADEMTKAGDHELAAILKEYQVEIRDGTRVEE